MNKDDQITLRNILEGNASVEDTQAFIGRIRDEDFEELKDDETMSQLVSAYMERNDFVPENVKWKGIQGDYIISLGKECSAEAGSKEGLQTLKASVGAFTRLWYGILPASSLVYSDGITAAKKLLKKLDEAFLLPPAHVDWGF